MKRSRAFVLVELLTTMLLQAGFILVMCASFYMLASFYSKTQQLLTARDHADRVILFFEDKIIHAGLGLWKCENPSQIRKRMKKIIPNGRSALASKRLPVHLENLEKNSGKIYYGDSVILLYAERDISSSNIMFVNTSEEKGIFSAETKNGDTYSASLTVDNLDTSMNWDETNFETTTNDISDIYPNIRSWAVAESVGFPFCVKLQQNTDDIYTYRDTAINSNNSNPPINNPSIPPATELLYLRCIQMFVQGKTTDTGGRQFAFCELKDDPLKDDPMWGAKYNQEEGVLEIYMELDTTTNIFTLWVMGTGGYDQTINNPRPANWPNRAAPLLNNNTNQNSTQAAQAWNNAGYNHHIVYVSRASWKLNNIPDGFNWN